MNDIEYYIDIIKDEEGWKPITNDLINEILENNKLYGFTLDNDDLKSIIDTLKDRLYHKKIKLLKSDIELLIKSDKKIYDKFKEITKKKQKHRIIYHLIF